MADVRITHGTSNSHLLTLDRVRGDLPNLTKKEFAELMLRYAPLAGEMTEDRTEMEIALPDGRLLRFWHILFPDNAGDPHEWHVQLYTLNQKTPRCLRKLHVREAWLYRHPYEGEGYKVDPTKTWAYSVYR